MFGDIRPLNSDTYISQPATTEIRRSSRPVDSQESFVGQPNVGAVLKQLDEWLAQMGKRDTPSLRSVRRLLSKTLAKADPAHVLAVADALVKRGDWADRLIAYETVAAHRPAFAALDETRLIRWSLGLSSWGNVDLFGCTLGGQAWREGILSDAVVESLSRSTDRWRRRLALVCTVPLNSKARGGAGDASRTLRICEALVDDRDDMVVKALSWSLRELAKSDAKAVRLFLSQNRDRLAPRVAREVTNKLASGKKNPGRDRRQPG
jgi:3-methyladenine DNA glycosylase AlkD